MNFDGTLTRQYLGGALDCHARLRRRVHRHLVNAAARVVRESRREPIGVAAHYYDYCKRWHRHRCVGRQQWQCPSCRRRVESTRNALQRLCGVANQLGKSDTCGTVQVAQQRVPLVVQSGKRGGGHAAGSEICAHCPAATISISKLTSSFKFYWLYADANSDLAEDFIISKLPALVIWRGEDD